LDSDDNLYIADTGNKRVLKYSAQGLLLEAVGGPGGGSGQFQEPVGLAVDANGLVYVADTWNQRVQVLDSDLTYLREWQIRGWKSVSVQNKPYIAVDEHGTVWTTDPESHRVLGFVDGEIAAVFGQYGSGMDGLNMPTGLTIAPNGQLCIADSENHRVLIFEAFPLTLVDGTE